MEDRLGAVRFVLCRPRNPQNVGAAARALRNAGVSRWVIVDPSNLDYVAARRVAVHAEELLERRRISPTLRDALAGCALTVGTTARARPERPLLTPLGRMFVQFSDGICDPNVRLAADNIGQGPSDLRRDWQRVDAVEDAICDGIVGGFDVSAVRERDTKVVAGGRAWDHRYPQRQ